MSYDVYCYNDFYVYGSIGSNLFGYDTCSLSSEDGHDIEKKTFYFLKHGVTDWNKEMLYRGPLDLSLNSAGSQQAHLASEHFLIIT